MRSVRRQIAAATLLLAAANLGVSARATATSAPGSPVGVWQGEQGGPNDVMTFMIDRDDTGEYMFFVHDSLVEACEHSPGVMWGNGREYDAGGPVFDLFYNGVYCRNGDFRFLGDESFRITVDPSGSHVESSDGWIGYPLCHPGFDSYVPAAMNVIRGTEHADRISGTRGPDLICGFGGNDTIRGFGGDDIIIGAEGNDHVYGGTGMDVLWGDLGADVLYGGFHSDGVFGNEGDDEIRPQAGHDYGYGGYGADILDGFFGNDDLEGGPGDDDAWGRNGRDFLRGGTGNDFLSGGAGGNDTADGEGGRDTCNAESEHNCEF
jgi:hypothetical protein